MSNGNFIFIDGMADKHEKKLSKDEIKRNVEKTKTFYKNLNKKFKGR